MLYYGNSKTNPAEKRRRARNPFAFTLIELLVVIAVIAVLMGILMPALRKAREQAFSTQCRGNLKGFTMAVAMYAQDWDDKFCDPRSSYFNTLDRVPGDAQGSYHHRRWCNGDVNLKKHPEYASDFLKYLVDAKGLICPTFKRIAMWRGTENWASNIDDGVSNYEPWQNYSMNAFLGPKKANPPIPAPPLVHTLSSVKNPSDVFTFADEGPFVVSGINRAGLNDTALYAAYPPSQGHTWISKMGNKWNVRPGPDGLNEPLVDIIGGFHNASASNPSSGKGNCAFADGHVGAVDHMDTFGHAWPK